VPAVFVARELLGGKQILWRERVPEHLRYNRKHSSTVLKKHFTRGEVMKHFALTFVVVCGFARTAASAHAQGMMRGPSIPKGILNPTVGSSSLYDFKSPKGDDTIEFAIVGKESVGGKDAFWFEWSMTGGPMGQMTSKMLTTFDGTNTAFSRVIFQMGSMAPMEMPEQMMHMSAQPPSDVRTVGDLVGTESVTTPAGTFMCEHYRMKDGSGDTWVSSKVLPIAVVKHVDKDSTLILLKTSSDAKDKITGTPQPFNPAAFMQQRPNQ
jgi:hypothetical protein